MSDGGRVERTAAPAERRPVPPTVVQRTAASIARSPAQALQDRLGFRATQQMIARSAAPRVGTTSPSVAQASKARRLPISSPRDPAELEAEAVARRVATMQASPAPAAPPPVAPAAGAAGVAHRSHNKSPSAPPSRSASPIENTGAGAPLPASVRSHMEPRFGADFGGVRVHTDGAAAQHSSALNAHAFTVGQHVYFGRDKFQPHSAGGKELIAHELTHTIQQGAAPQSHAVHRSAAVSQQAAPSVQRSFLGIPNPREYFAGKAANIPGYTMLTVVIGYDPILGAKVARTAGNILRGAIQLIPGGKMITDALNAHGVFDSVSNWAATQFETLKDIGARLMQDIDDFIKNISITDLGGAWDRGKAMVMRVIDRIIAFAIALKDGIVKLIKDAILKPIAAFARTTNGYPLLCTILGKDPITGEQVPQDAEALLGGFLKFIGEEETWNTIQKAKAIPRTIAWFKGAVKALTGFLKEIPGLFVAAFKALTVEDIILIPRAFSKLVGVFGNFAVRFITWGANAVWTLLEIIFDVVAPGALVYIKKTGAALKSIFKNPLPFMGNLVKAAKLGFTNFGEHFLDHLKAGLIDWLTGALPGIYIPKAFSLVEIAKFVFSVLGLTWANIRQKLVKATSEPVVKAMETGFDIVVTLVRDGPAAAWDKIKEQLANLKDMVIGGITDFVVDMVVKKAIPKLISMFIPGAGFISAILSIYDTIMVFVNKIKQIIQVVTGFIDSIVAIAAGQIGAAAARVEGALAGILSLAINFLAGFAGLGKVADKVMGVINKIRAPIDKALDWLVNFIVTGAKKLFAKVFGKKDKPDARTEEEKKRDLDAALKEANRILDADHPGEAGVLAKLQPLKARYGLTALSLVAETRDQQKVKYHVHLVINPEVDSKPQEARTQLDEIMVDPKFKFATGGRGKAPEFERQLQIQQTAMNAMNVAKWLANRSNWGTPGGGERSPEGTRKQAEVLERERDAFRQRAMADRTAAYKARGLGEQDAAVAAVAFVNRLLARELMPTNRSKYKHERLTDQFGVDVENEMWRKVALHALDQVAGGEGTEIVGVGGESEDKSIGRQWVVGGRITKIQENVEGQVKKYKLTEEQKGQVKMNVKLLPYDS